ncbi:peptidase M56 family protein [Gottschalkia acidurici 9a]|uniref:Peptidase M56 family protein n=1 Tax=Gottschalkia acidurici (strain ATCC 7906 / DSM 604 / BCRC 14475 / CIP 104303 / KCTC 5404 / NCIMB 10678 / 9a) TaxID=1128398 RepID=K0B530_GOTA9|nr:M56 family metallopeptidase [Gottschalkia acidurici]AFS79666.1 peptidase M56 family protein [Gottschalkia acidurici 9a]
MNILEKALLWVLYSSFIATIMTILILAIKKLFKNYTSPRFQHALWFLILIRLLLPISVGSPLDLIDNVSESYKDIIDFEKTDLYKSSNSKESKDSLNNDIEEYRTGDISRLNDNSKITTEEMYEENTLKGKSLKIEKLLYEFKEQEKDSIEKIIKISSCIWITGFSVMAIFVFFITFRFKCNTKEFYKVNNPHIEHILKISKDKLGLNKNISIYSNNEFKSPFIYGVLNPKIYIPKYVLDKATSQELLHIILHELAHYKRKDLISNLISIIAILFYWFNPVIWFAMKKMREDREIACDSYILEVLEEHESVEYGMTILSFSKDFFSNSYKNNLNLCFYESKTQIERRIMMIRKFKKGSYKMSVLSIALLTLSGSVVLAGSGGNILDSNTAIFENQSLEKKDNEDFKLYPSNGNGSLIFSNLDRASDFIDFRFKVPDYLPSETQLMSITLNDDKGNLIGMSFGKSKPNSKLMFESEGRFNFLVSKEDLIENLKNRHKSRSNGTEDITVEYKEKPFSISNIHGQNVTITSRAISKISSDESNAKDIEINEMEYFIWNSKDIWYGIEYEKPYGISRNDIEKIVTSLKNFEDVSKDKYTSKNYRTYRIYEKKDLEVFEEILGFKPKLYLNLSKELVANGARLDNIRNEWVMITSYGSQDGSSIKISFIQGKDTNYYDSLKEKDKSGIDDSFKNEKGPLNTSHRVDKSRTTSLKINDIDVFVHTQVDTYDNPKETFTQTDYVWKQDNIVYYVNVYGEPDNHEDIEDIIKDLMK